MPLFDPESLPLGEFFLYQSKLNTAKMVELLKNLSPAEGSTFTGYPHNVDTIQVIRMSILAANTPYQGPALVIPDGFVLVIKAAPTNAVGNFVFIAPSAGESVNINQSWPLVPNEWVSFGIKNAESIWFSGSSAGDFVLFTVERLP